MFTASWLGVTALCHPYDGNKADGVTTIACGCGEGKRKWLNCALGLKLLLRTTPCHFHSRFIAKAVILNFKGARESNYILLLKVGKTRNI